MINIYPFILLTIKSPYFTDLKNSWRRNKQKLINTEEQLNFILEETRTDVYNQFTEKQSEWKANAQYTIDKKTKAKSDLRIMHESKGDGRLKDAYFTTGSVVGNQLIYFYPTSKPYARDLQEGATIDNPNKAKQKRKGTSVQQTQANKLDAQYIAQFGYTSFAGLFD